MSLSPYVFFNGSCRAALTFYGEIFGSTPELMDASGMPPDIPVPEDRKDWIMHGSVPVAGGVLMASDDVFDESAPMAGCGVQVDMPTAADGKAVFDALAEGGQVRMAWEPTFWSAGFGTLTDKFGIRWMIGTSEAP